MTAMPAECSSVPFHLGLTEPIDETTIAGYPTVDGAYDPVEQMWRLPDGTPLTDAKARTLPFSATESYSVFHGTLIIDDVHVD